ncbi:hypothetical protein [Hirschia maritima]|uniref:hypothetical protein n=1 Tax=Hirschia maritima TaxID=1121961 RepID=UPI00036AD4C2|nr:hypothetical protein [Hirschia maritima]
MGKLNTKAACIVAIASVSSLTACTTTTPSFIPHSVPSLYGPTASDMPTHAGANEERCAAIQNEITHLNEKLQLPNIDEDKGILKPAKFNRGEIRRAYLMGLARGIPCPRSSLEATMSIDGDNQPNG